MFSVLPTFALVQSLRGIRKSVLYYAKPCYCLRQECGNFYFIIYVKPTSHQAHDVVLTLIRFGDVASTSVRRHCDVMCPLSTSVARHRRPLCINASVRTYMRVKVDAKGVALGPV